MYRQAEPETTQKIRQKLWTLESRLFVFGRRFIRGQMFPETIIAPLELIIQTLAALALNQTLSGATIIDYHDSKFRIHFPLAIPVTAGCTDFDFGRKNQFFSHGFGRVGIGKHESWFSGNGSMRGNEVFARWL